MLTSSGSRVRRDGTIATSSKPYARLAVLPMPISNSMPSPTPASARKTQNAHRLPDGRHFLHGSRVTDDLGRSGESCDDPFRDDHGGKIGRGPWDSGHDRGVGDHQTVDAEHVPG